MTIQTAFTKGSALRVVGGAMLRRELVGQTRFRTDLTIGEDFYFLYENLLKGATTVIVKQRWYYYRYHPGNHGRKLGLPDFVSRFERRRLVWENEDALGRRENAAQQKQEVFSIFLSCCEAGQMDRGDRKKMCGLMKKYRKEILPTLSAGRKLRFWLHVYFPSTVLMLKWLKDKRK